MIHNEIKGMKQLDPHLIGFAGQVGKERGRAWSINSGLRIVLTNIMKVCGELFVDFASLLSLGVASGKTGSILAELGIINSNSAGSWNTEGLDLRITNSWVLSGAQICNTLISKPIEGLAKLLWDYTPSIEYDGIKISKLFIGTALEDIVFIELIQRTALPLFTELLPKRCGYILNHKVTRVVLSSAIFALAHNELAKASSFGVMPQFILGLISGTVAELDDSLFIPIIGHFAYDLILGGGRYL